MVRLFLLAGVVGVLFAGGVRADDEAKTKGKKKARQASPDVVFKRLDGDNDGKVSAEEFKNVGAAAQGKLKDRPELADRFFKRLDADGDGYLSKHEFKKMSEMRKKAADKKKKKADK
jgi:hypothetical protein